MSYSQGKRYYRLMMISQKQIFILHTFLDVTAILLNPLGHILAHIQNHNMLVKSFDFCSLFQPSEQSRHTSGKELQAASPHMFFPRMIRKYLCGMKTRQKKITIHLAQPYVGVGQEIKLDFYPSCPQPGPHEFFTIQQGVPFSLPYPTANTAWLTLSVVVWHVELKGKRVQTSNIYLA